MFKTDSIVTNVFPEYALDQLRKAENNNEIIGICAKEEFLIAADKSDYVASIAENAINSSDSFPIECQVILKNKSDFESFRENALQAMTEAENNLSFWCIYLKNEEKQFRFLFIY